MKLLDKIALNRLISIITSFILSLVKIIAPKTNIEDTITKPKRPILDKLRNIIKK